MNEREIREKLSSGHIRLRAIIEVVGKPEKYVKDSLAGFISKINDNKNLHIIEQTIEEPVERENFWNAFAELELLAKNAAEVMYFCFDFMPSSIEIIEPEEFVLKNSGFSNFLNDLMQRLHTVNTGFIQLQDQSTFYVKSTAVLLRNFLIVLLSDKTLTIEEIKKFVGLKEEDIKKVLAVLIKEGKVEKIKDKYRAKAHG